MTEIEAREALRSAGLRQTQAQIAILRALVQPKLKADVAREIEHVDRQTVSSAVDRMYDRGLLTRQTCDRHGQSRYEYEVRHE